MQGRNTSLAGRGGFPSPTHDSKNSGSSRVRLRNSPCRVVRMASAIGQVAIGLLQTPAPSSDDRFFVAASAGRRTTAGSGRCGGHRSTACASTDGFHHGVQQEHGTTPRSGSAPAGRPCADEEQTWRRGVLDALDPAARSRVRVSSAGQVRDLLRGQRSTTWERDVNARTSALCPSSRTSRSSSGRRTSSWTTDSPAWPCREAPGGTAALPQTQERLEQRARWDRPKYVALDAVASEEPPGRL